MGGFAVAIDWAAPQPPDIAERMLAAVPHRTSGGSAFRKLRYVSLGEGHTDAVAEHGEITTAGPYTIVGDMRLWNKDGLISRAGGSESARGLGNRGLALQAYARSGISFLDDLDGDFAFVLWDDDERTALAVRDRFGVKPLFYQVTDTGVRFASEIKQLIRASDLAPTPCDTAVAEFLTGRHHGTDLTFFDGIAKVRPAEFVKVSDSMSESTRYWIPSFSGPDDLTPSDIPHMFRERLVDSVQRRVASSQGTMVHVTGGLDSSSIAAAAAEMPDVREYGAGVQTVSAVFPGTDLDESQWIDEIATRQPFTHHDFVPRIETIEGYAEAMWEVDSLVFNRIAGMWPGTADIAAASGCDLVLMGSGGDEVLEQDRIAADLLRRRAVGKWWRAVSAEGDATDGLLTPLAWSVAQALPMSLKRPLRGLVNRGTTGIPTIVSPELLEAADSSRLDPHLGVDAPSATQSEVMTSLWHSRRVLVNESQEATYAARGIDVSYPYLDRDLVEFVTSLSPLIRPLDGKTKSLVRFGFADQLPRSVLDRTTKTFADSYLGEVFDRLKEQYGERFEKVPDLTRPYIDEQQYALALSAASQSPTDRSVQRQLWTAWTLMQWVDGFARY